MKVKILIAEDDLKISRLLVLELEYEGYETTVCHDGMEAVQAVEQNRFDLLLLDVMLPKLSGLEILRRFRKNDRTTPVIMLTAKADVTDKVSGLDSGANDYITKPFENEELLARIRVQLRKSKQEDTESESMLTLADVVVYPERHEVYRNDQLIELTAKEFRLLVYLLENQGHVLTRDQLLQHVWGYDYIGDTNVTDVYIRYLRKKIDHNASVSLIHTVRGVGYVMKVVKP
ncbi:response regulator transcription factor [Geomicrobium sp. JCM 19038]|uniref:response regulator transcription factor n=1 Tax=Geomicrobium sp. JCM 19038 TaxID=1460635 RepID=UPI0005A88F48|nr:response regulator transcription factor [Geomicrobium sp. JCM 19038]